MKAMPTTVEDWLDQMRQAVPMRVEPLPLRACPGWLWREDVWRHDSGRYFSVVGVRASVGSRVIEQPMIDQPEIGVLGFVVRCPNAPEWLLQAKAEPGNVKGTQVGPSVQATQSNYQRVHGGLPTPMIDCFVGSCPPGVRVWSDSLQSEQGDRFLGKYNRNALVEVPHDHAVPDAAQWRWFAAAEVRRALLVDYAINTDSRSVMVCSPWHWMTDDGTSAFTRWQEQPDTWGHALWCSAQSADAPEVHACLSTKLTQARADWAVSLQRLPLTDLHGWQVREDGVFSTDVQASLAVQAFEVHAPDREVQHWAQPLVVGGRSVRVTLLCTRHEGLLKVLLRLAPEPGFKDGVQWGPSDIEDAAHHRLAWVGDLMASGDVTVHADVNQSDEGGRFMHSVARYLVCEVPSELVPLDPSDAHWVSLSVLQTMAQTSGLLTNEARSAVSLLLAWA